MEGPLLVGGLMRTNQALSGVSPPGRLRWSVSAGEWSQVFSLGGVATEPTSSTFSTLTYGLRVLYSYEYEYFHTLRVRVLRCCFGAWPVRDCQQITVCRTDLYE